MTNKLKLNFLGDLDPMKSLSRLSVNSLRLFTIFEEEKVLDVIDDDQSSEHRQLGNINQSHFYSLFLVEVFLSFRVDLFTDQLQFIFDFPVFGLRILKILQI